MYQTLFGAVHYFAGPGKLKAISSWIWGRGKEIKIERGMAAKWERKI